jgi:hypothetical protein
MPYVVNESCIKCKYMDCVEVCLYVCVKSLRRLATAIALPFIRCLFPLGTLG